MQDNLQVVSPSFNTETTNKLYASKITFKERNVADFRALILFTYSTKNIRGLSA